MKRAPAVLVSAIALVAFAGCGGERSGIRAQITVLAASSLTETFTKLGREYEKEHPETKVTFTFGASSTLAQQILSGAPGDVYAAASPATMNRVTAARAAAAPPEVFVRNRLVIAVPRGNPDGVKTLVDLTRVTFAQCAEQVPCGASAIAVFKAANIWATPATFESDVKATLTKLRLGEVDAALVYRTDTRSATEVDYVDFCESDRAINDYLIAPLSSAKDATKAHQFIEYLRTPQSRAVFAEAGFALP